jgi:hypothetical protein
MVSPYSQTVLPWLKGNLHTHTTASDGFRTPQATLDGYARRGYDFLMISDHDRLLPHDGLDAHGMILIPGNEISADGPHILHVGARSVIPPHPDRQNVLEAINRESGFAVACHPNWREHFAHWPRELLERHNGYLGIEVYNSVIRRLPGTPLATDRWDRLLGLGRRIWGFANDDTHRPEDEGLAWNMVQCASREPAAVVEALCAGRFYATTGVTIDRIAVRGHTLTVQTRNAQRIIAYVDFGQRLTTVDDHVITVTVPENAPFHYVRVECWGPGEQMAWTQPFFLEGSS